VAYETCLLIVKFLTKTALTSLLQNGLVRINKNWALNIQISPTLLTVTKKLTESAALIHYIPIKGGKKELIGNNDDKFIHVQVALSVAHDLRTDLNHLCWTMGDFKTEKEDAFTKGGVKSKLELLNKNLEGKEWLTGFLSIADFQLFEAVELIHDIEPSRLEPYPNLASFFKRFAEIPHIKAHRESEHFVKVWYPPQMTAWSNAQQ